VSFTLGNVQEVGVGRKVKVSTNSLKSRKSEGVPKSDFTQANDKAVAKTVSYV